MVPSYYTALDDLPYTPNGKVDKKTLPLPTNILNTNKEDYVAPKTKLQKQLVNIFEKTLNTKPIGINDNFFELGGDSLLAMNLNVEFQKISNKITYQDIFRFPTICELEEIIESNDKKSMFSKVQNLPDSFIDILSDSQKREKIKKYYPKNILLTGSTGFLGIHILEELLRLEDTNIYYQFALEENAESKKANLDYLIELASSFYSTVGNTLNAYIKYIDNLKDKQDTSTSSAKIIGENEDVVRIMTIHKSKGLEFPIVILADTAKNYNFSDARKQKVVFHHKYGIGIDIVNQDLGVTYPSLIKQAIRSVIEKETKSEEIRLFYVARTRAKEKLYIFATTKDYEKEYEAQSINFKDGKFNETLIASNTSYYKNMLPVIKYYNKFEGEKKDLDIERIEVKSNTTDEELKEMLTSKNIENKKESISEKALELFKDKNADEKIINELKNNLESEYQYSKDAHTPSRISVSNLKKSKNDEDNMSVLSKISDENEDIKVENEFEEPVCLKEKEERYTAVRKGLLIHFILQNLDFKTLNTKEELRNYIEKLVFEKVISEQDKKYINVSRIYNFLNSKIGKDLKEAKKTFREYEFILMNKDISNSLIQGVIDLFYVTKEDKVVLVDFKTDRIDNEKEFIKKYKIQLEIYKEAINSLTEYNVDEIFIYSFNLNKEIKIEEEINE